MTGRDDENARDDDVPDLTPEDELAVSALLAALPPTPMPPEVLTRIEAALAAEPPLAAAPAVTTLAQARDRHRTSRGTLVFRIAASVVALVGLTVFGVAVLNGGGAESGGSSGSTADLAEGASSAAASRAAAGASSPASGYRVTNSGTTYTAANLAAQATALLAAAQPAQPAAGSATAPGSSDFGVDDRAKVLATSPSKLASCVKELTDGDGRTPLAVDSGRWGSQPAIVVVLPADGASGQRQVFVVKPTCGTTDDSSDILQVAFLDS